MRQLKIEYLETDKLIPYINNPRINGNAVDAVAGSIAEFGFRNPIIIDKDNVIIAGHTRLLAAKKLGLTEVPVVRADDLTEAQVKAYRIADNKTAEFAEWDTEMLALELEEIGDLFTGFSDEELEELVGMKEQPEEDGFDIGAALAAIEEPITQPGDMWQLGRHRVMCGDSTQAESVARLLGNAKAEIVVYDPPYDMNGAYEHIPAHEPGTRLIVFWDYQRTAAAILGAVAAGHSFLYEFIWDCQTSWYTPNRPLMRHKACGVFGDDPAWRFERALYRDDKSREAHIVSNTRGSYRYQPNPDGVHLQTVFSSPITREFDGHAHAKPVKWIAALLAGCGGDIVLDLFGGSGSTLIATEATGQTSYTMEIEPKYCDVIVKRWEDLTGEKAVRLA